MHRCKKLRKDEGTKSPLFLYQKMFKKTVTHLLEEGLKQKPNLFLIDFSISPDNAIKIIIDGDQGVTVEDCMFISRAIEHNIDRDEHDFSLEVASAGVSTPLTHNRQYTKNIGRNLEVKTLNETLEGTLVDANEDEITLQWKTREAKPVGKGKVTVNKKAAIAYKNIVEAKVMIKF